MTSTANQRIIALVDMDCFYCQVETRLDPNLKGKPVAVVQYNQWKGGGIIAVNYEARDLGVTRYMRGAEAKQKCPKIILVSVPTVRGKADLSKYRDAGDQVAQVFSQFSDCVQRASIDEAFIDLTKAVNERIKNGLSCVKFESLQNTYIVGHCDLKSNDSDQRSSGLLEWLKMVESQANTETPEFRLAVGGLIVEEMRTEIFNKTGFHCSAGVAHNKILAKLVAGLHKPKCQTILPHDAVPELYNTLPVNKVRNLGGKLGKFVSEKLNVKYMSELYKFTLQELQQKLDEKTGAWLYNIARGIDLDPVTPRLIPDSIGCCKNFPGAQALKTVPAVEHWVKELSAEIAERLGRDLEKNKRRAKLLTVTFYLESPLSRSGPLTSYEASGIAKDALELLRKQNTAPTTSESWQPPIKCLGISVSKFIEEQSSIGKYLKAKTPGEMKDGGSTSASKFSGSETPAVENGGTNPQGNDIARFFKKGQDKPREKAEISEQKCRPKSSFFLSFLNKNKGVLGTEKENESEETEDENEEMWISLSEVFPNVNEVDDEVVELLPPEMKEKLKERMKNEPSTSSDLSKNISVPEKETEVCRECSKNIPLMELVEHLDHHAAVKLHAEINADTTDVQRTPKKEPVCGGFQSKRKRGRPPKTPDKKLKSITSFFKVVPK